MNGSGHKVTIWGDPTSKHEFHWNIRFPMNYKAFVNVKPLLGEHHVVRTPEISAWIFSDHNIFILALAIRFFEAVFSTNSSKTIFHTVVNSTPWKKLHVCYKLISLSCPVLACCHVKTKTQMHRPRATFQADCKCFSFFPGIVHCAFETI